MAFDQDRDVVAVVVQPYQVDIDSFQADSDMVLGQGRVDRMVDSLAAYFPGEHSFAVVVVVVVVDNFLAGVVAFVVAAAENW